MKSLSDVIQQTMDGGKPEYEELRYALLAMSSLSVFNRQAFMRLADAEKSGKKPFMTTSANWQFEEHYRREQAALSKPPKEWLGWNNDPENPEFLKRRKISQKIMSGIVSKIEA
jgi:hypothetical protein